ncbi:undecaprenyl-phosphate glucose phosphotransferase [Emcibacter sp. SYSU 3D8]|uniref:undecaprenyl-phosphate glucose phosphotransferase n=1 Tax=Emcibacter sp. SYSU 3D8 TaxID=3133969 RepID=UPI0031FEBA52
MAGDVIVILAAAIIASQLKFGELELAPNYLFPVFLGAILSVNIFRWRRLYALETYARRAQQTMMLIGAQLLVTLILLGIGFGSKTSADFSRVWFTLWMTISTAGLVVWFFVRAAFVRAAQDNGALCDRLLLVGDPERIASFSAWLASKNTRMLKVLGVVTIGNQMPVSVDGCPVRNGVEHLAEMAETLSPDRVVLLFNWREPQTIDLCVASLRSLALDVELMLPRLGHEWIGRPIATLGGLPAMNLMRSPLSMHGRIIKLVADYLLATTLLLALLPMLAAVSILIKLDSPGPVFYVQRRIGFQGREFSILKFRTMYANGEAGFRQATRGDPRITRIGRFLRASSIDELPQLLNVLRGDMSLVGPRPHAVDMNAEFAARIDDYLARHKIKPGITGWAQVHDARGETRSIEDMQRRVAYDLAYVDNWSLWLDLQILLRTASVVLFQKNAY